MDASAFNGFADRTVQGLVLSLVACIAALIYLAFN